MQRADRLAIAVIAVAALTLSLLYLARPGQVNAAGSVQVWLAPQFQGANSATFQSDSDCGPFTAGVVWHFVLNQLDDNTQGGSLTAMFASASDQTVSVTKVLNNVQHFYVDTPTDDTLNNAFALVDEMSGQTDANLLLSHVCHTGVEPSQPPSEAPSQPASEAPSEAPSQPASEAPSEEPSQPASEAPSTEASVEASTSPEGSVLAATGSPEPSTPNTAFGIDPTNPLPTILFAFVLLAGLAGLAWMNVRMVRRS
jgi:hypothetical protein